MSVILLYFRWRIKQNYGRFRKGAVLSFYLMKSLDCFPYKNLWLWAITYQSCLFFNFFFNFFLLTRLVWYSDRFPLYLYLCVIQGYTIKIPTVVNTFFVTDSLMGSTTGWPSWSLARCIWMANSVSATSSRTISFTLGHRKSGTNSIKL